MLDLMLATPFPRSSFSRASASASLTALILAASPSFSAAIFLLSEALISFIEARTSDGGSMFLICTVSIVKPASFILGPTQLMMASVIYACDSNSWSRVSPAAALRTTFSVQLSICLLGSERTKRALAESSGYILCCSDMSILGKTLSAVLAWMTAVFSQMRLLTT